MRRIPKLTAIAITASILLGGESFADSIPADRTAQLEQTIASFNGDFDVEFGNEFNRNGYQKNLHALPLSAVGIERLQAAIQRNRPLAERLRATGIKVNTIINAQKSGNGSLTFFARHDMR
jgi:hypothetical protein